MSEYDVVLKDNFGCDITTDLVEGLPDAKKRATYFLSDAYAKTIGTTHETLGTHKVEIQATRTAVCIWDAFLKKA